MLPCSAARHLVSRVAGFLSPALTAASLATAVRHTSSSSWPQTFTGPLAEVSFDEVKDKFNHVELVGNVTSDPRQAITAKGLRSALMCLARNPPKNNTRPGEQQRDDPMFFNVIAFGQLAERLVNHVRKGDQLLVKGKLLQKANANKPNSPINYEVRILAQDVYRVKKFVRSERGSAAPSSSSQAAPQQ